MEQPEIIVDIKNGGVKHDDTVILSHINLTIHKGELVYLTGRVGSGKSSFLRMLYADLPLEYGTAHVAGFELKDIKRSKIPMLRRRCGIAFQDFKLLTDRNVAENLRFVLRATGWKKSDIEKRVDEVLESVGMLHAKEKMPFHLSGGEQKRVVIARALLNTPDLIIADEPTANLDRDTARDIMTIFKDIQKMGKTLIIATHQPDILEEFPGRVIVCKDNTIIDNQTELAKIELKLNFE
jgi:cell division transport system ATP-binding protein